MFPVNYSKRFHRKEVVENTLQSKERWEAVVHVHKSATRDTRIKFSLTGQQQQDLCSIGISNDTINTLCRRFKLNEVA